MKKYSITYLNTRYDCTIFLPLRKTIEESTKRRHLWHGSTERSQVRLDVLSVMLTLQWAPEAVNKSGCKVGFEVSIAIGLCSPIPIINNSGSVLTSILGPTSFVTVIKGSLKGINVDFLSSGR